MTLFFMIIGLLAIFVTLLIRAEFLQNRKQVNKFRKPLKYHRMGLALYYSGQLLLALSTLFFNVN